MRVSLRTLLVLVAILMSAAAPSRAAGAHAVQDHATTQSPFPWDEPPPEFREIERRGFHAGVRAAIKDFDHHRHPGVERHKRYAHPKVDRSLYPDYRQGFRRGYNSAMNHLTQSNGRHS